MASKKIRSTGDAIAACDDVSEAFGVVLGSLLTYASMGVPPKLDALEDIVGGMQRFNRMRLPADDPESREHHGE